MKVLGSVWRWIFSILLPVAIMGLLMIALSVNGVIDVTAEATSEADVVTANGAFVLTMDGLLMSAKNLGVGIKSEMQVTYNILTGNIEILNQSTQTGIKNGEFTFNIIIVVAAACFLAGMLLTLIGHHNKIATGLGLGLILAGFIIFMVKGQGNATLAMNITLKDSSGEKPLIALNVPFLNTLILGIASIVLAAVNFIFSFFLGKK